MNGVHDLGGMHGFGAVDAEPDEPVFHHDWERRCFGLTLACGFLGRWNLDASRFARECMDPAEYLATSYYEHWLHGLERLLVDRGLVSADELASGRATRPAEDARALPANRVEALFAAGGAARVDAPHEPQFRAGQPVRARNVHPVGHTRIPRYVRGRTGVVDRDHGVFVFPDTHAESGEPSPQHVYAVRFEAAELWGPHAGPRDAVYVDLWDAYLEPA